MKILGIDPGFARLGWGVVGVERPGGKPQAVDWGCVETDSKEDFSKRILQIALEIKKICKEHSPAFAAMEKLFFAKNAKTAMKVGEARGAVLLALSEAGIMVREISPKEVKLSIAAYGGAGKQQIGKMIKLLLKLDEIPKPDDAADALGIALAASAKPEIYWE